MDRTPHASMMLAVPLAPLASPSGHRRCLWASCSCWTERMSRRYTLLSASPSAQGCACLPPIYVPRRTAIRPVYVRLSSMSYRWPLLSMTEICRGRGAPHPPGAIGSRHLDGRLRKHLQHLSIPSWLLPPSKCSYAEITGQAARRDSHHAPPRQQIDIHLAKERSLTVTDDDPAHIENRNAHDGSEGAVYKPRTIRFSDSEWDEVQEGCGRSWDSSR